ncbi:MAG: DUF4245 family protein [Microbacterium sp.]
MAQTPRIVAELGRPETPDETAARKAESSRVHRASQNTRNLVAALLVTLVVVAVIIFGVPRGTPPAAEPIDVARIAAQVERSEGHAVVAPETPEGWLVNRAGIDGDDSVRTWTIVYAPSDENERGFLRVAQGFAADESWPARVLSGAGVQGTETIGGVAWDRYDVDPARAANVSVALSTTAGADTILIYGQAGDAKLDEVAASVAAQVLEIREESE